MGELVVLHVVDDQFLFVSKCVKSRELNALTKRWKNQVLPPWFSYKTALGMHEKVEKNVLPKHHEHL
jgi:hypothetical protein